MTFSFNEGQKFLITELYDALKDRPTHQKDLFLVYQVIFGFMSVADDSGELIPRPDLDLDKYASTWLFMKAGAAVNDIGNVTADITRLYTAQAHLLRTGQEIDPNGSFVQDASDNIAKAVIEDIISRFNDPERDAPVMIAA